MAGDADPVLAAARAFLDTQRSREGTGHVATTPDLVCDDCTPRGGESADKYDLVCIHHLAAFARAQRAAALEEAADALLGHWKQLSNERTEAVFTSFRRNATDAGIAEARKWLRRRAEEERKG